MAFSTARKKFSTAIGAALAVFSLGEAVAAPEIKSAYTSVELENCLLFQKEALGQGWVCPGEAGYNLVLTQFDDRVALEVVRPDWPRNAIIPLTAVAPVFSWVAGTVAEWRIGPEGPGALILRIGVSETRERPEAAETRLLVLRLGGGAGDGPPPLACLVGAVSGRGGANEAARAMADQAAELPCLR